MPQPIPNLHHLELFYHVARAGGITAAVRTMPYGIQQPAISGQVAQLEAELGVRLFQRRPFTLTPAGRELYDFLAPFFGALPQMAERIAGKASKHLRMAAPATVIRDHLPQVLADIRKEQPELELSLIDAGQNRIFELLEQEEVDFAVAELEGRAPSGMKTEVLLSLPLVLLLPPGLAMPKAGLKALAEEAALVRTAEDTAIARLFAKGLNSKGIRWPARIEVNSIDLVHAYVAEGFGVGVSVPAPGVKFPKGVKAVELKGFPDLAIAGVWRGKLGPLASEVMAGLRKRAKG
ncbi:LysR substrate-binding domain-containing protein [Haloferula chungangensis]|uniref:LysR substrate-binding domain-containing protein n=1 Tax=Haloferula chungangensis TaxID=1048331 RepID=A0ABW2L8E2_9BACT